MCFCDSKGKTVLAECADDLFRNILKICWKIYSRKNVWIAYLRNIAIKYILRNIEHSIRGWSCWYWCNIYIDIGYRYTERQIDGVPMPDIWETMCEWQVGLVWHVNPLNPDPGHTDCSNTPSRPSPLQHLFSPTFLLSYISMWIQIKIPPNPDPRHLSFTSVFVQILTSTSGFNIEELCHQVIS